MEAGILSIINCTVSLNQVSGGAGGTSDPSVSGDAGQPGEGIGGGIFNHSGVILLLNTITAGNSAGNESPDLYGAFFSSGFNLPSVIIKALLASASVIMIFKMFRQSQPFARPRWSHAHLLTTAGQSGHRLWHQRRCADH